MIRHILLALTLLILGNQRHIGSGPPLFVRARVHGRFVPDALPGMVKAHGDGWRSIAVPGYGPVFWSRTAKALCLASVVVAVLLLGSLPPAAAMDQQIPLYAHENSHMSGWPMHLRLQSGAFGSPWAHLGPAIADELSRNVLPTASKLGGGLLNLAEISNGTAEIVFCIAGVHTAKNSGEPEYAELAIENAVLLAKMYPQVLYIVARKEFAEQYGLTDVASLINLKAPLRFMSLKPGTASHFLLDMLLRYGYGVDYHQLKNENGWTYYYANFAEMVDMFASGELDCLAVTAGANANFLKTLEEYAELTVLAVEEPVLARLEKKFKTGMYTILPGTLQSVGEPVLTLNDHTVLFVHKDMPDTLAYAIARTLWESRVGIAREADDFMYIARDPRIEGVPAHPGALKFWDSLPRP